MALVDLVVKCLLSKEIKIVCAWIAGLPVEPSSDVCVAKEPKELENQQQNVSIMYAGTAAMEQTNRVPF